MAKVDLRKLKDQATRAVEKQQYAKAAELYLEIAAHEPQDPDWRQRAGEALRKVPDLAAAVAQLVEAAAGYARSGFLLKAIAVCKAVLQLDRAHTATQQMLAELYAKRDGRPSGAAPSASLPPPSPTDVPTPAPAAPLDIVPLHAVLGGRKSQQFAAITVADAAAYEIALDEDVVLADAVPIDLPSPPAPRLPTIADESVFSELLDHGSPDLPLPPAALPPIPLLSSLRPEDLRHVIERVELREVAAGEVILREREPGRSLFVVVAGQVQVLAEGPPPRELALLEEGAFFGELAILTDFPRSATVVARAPTQIIEISRELVSDIVRRSPEVLKTLLRFFRDRLLDRLLSTSPLFAPFAPAEARALAERFVFLELAPGMRIIAAGERAPGLFVLLCGDARVVLGGGEVARLGPGDVFGEISLLERSPATATIETRSKCWALELPREHFQEIMVTYPQMLEYVSDVAQRRKQQNLHVDFL
jgi:CRP-like cAMP-binding protein